MDSAASLHMMRRNELTSGEEEIIRRSKEPTIDYDRRRKSKVDRKATVYVTDLDALHR